jgi:hypothetical protein
VYACLVSFTSSPHCFLSFLWNEENNNPKNCMKNRNARETQQT